MNARLNLVTCGYRAAGPDEAGALTQAQSGMDLEERPVLLITAVSRLDQQVTHLPSRSSQRDPHRPAVTVLAVHLYQLHTGRFHQHTHKNTPSTSPQAYSLYRRLAAIIIEINKECIYFPHFQAGST